MARRVKSNRWAGSGLVGKRSTSRGRSSSGTLSRPKSGWYSPFTNPDRKTVVSSKRKRSGWF